MRSILTALVMFFSIYICCPVLLVETIIKKIKPEACFRSTYHIVKFVFGIVRGLSGVDLTVIGADNVPTDRPVVFIGNHRSYFDIFLTYSISKIPMGYIAKDSINKIPLVGIWMRNMHCIFLNRENAKEGLKTIKEGISNIENGYSMYIFPEGHCTPTDGMLTFKDGSFKLATKPGAPIIPVTISGTENIFEMHKPWIKKAKVTIMYGEPIETAGMPRAEQKGLASQVQSIVADNLKQLAISEGREPVALPVDDTLWDRRHELVEAANN